MGANLGGAIDGGECSFLGCLAERSGVFAVGWEGGVICCWLAGQLVLARPCWPRWVSLGQRLASKRPGIWRLARALGRRFEVADVPQVGTEARGSGMSDSERLFGTAERSWSDAFGSRFAGEFTCKSRNVFECFL